MTTYRPVRARSLERWLNELIAIYQDRKRRPSNRVYSRLTRLTRPTQIYAITMSRGRQSLGVILVTHARDANNGRTVAVTVKNLQELAEFSNIADDYFGTSGMVREEIGDLRLLFPDIKVAAEGCVNLADEWRQTDASGRLPPKGFHVGSQRWLQTSPPAALWTISYSYPLPSPRTALLNLGEKRARRMQPAATEREVPAQPDAAICFAAFAEPLVWFGEPPFPRASDRILRRIWHGSQFERLLDRGLVGGVETFIYKNGLVLALTSDRQLARETINHVFGVLSRSGMSVLAVPYFELIEVKQFDEDVGTIGGASSVVSPRNRLFGVASLDDLAGRSYSLPEGVTRSVLAIANECTHDPATSVYGLRLLDAATLFARETFTEAFVAAWTLIESVVDQEFEEFWIHRGRSKTGIKDMDWTVSQQTDLLLAIGTLAPEVARRIHQLRKRRNAIVHELAQASEQDASECIEQASVMTQVPKLEKELEPYRVLL